MKVRHHMFFIIIKSLDFDIMRISKCCSMWFLNLNIVFNPLHVEVMLPHGKNIYKHIGFDIGFNIGFEYM